MTGTYRGESYDQCIAQTNARFEMCRNMFIQNVNYVSAILSNPENFGVSGTDIEQYIKECIDYYRIVLNTEQYISLDGIKESIEKAINPQRVREINDKALDMETARTNIDQTIVDCIAGLIGMIDTEEEKKVYEYALNAGVFKENDLYLTTNESYERSYLKKNEKIADLFFMSGGISVSSLDIKTSNLKFRYNSDSMTIGFSMMTHGRHATFPEVYCNCLFTGPCQLSLRGTFVVNNDSVFGGSPFKYRDWVISPNKTCGAMMCFDEVLREKYLYVTYCRLLSSSTYNLQEYLNNFTYEFRQLLRENQFNISW